MNPWVGGIVILLSTWAHAWGQRPPEAESSAVQTAAAADAYHQFVLGRALEGRGEDQAALEAYERAAALDPASAEILAEIAGLHVRQNRGTEAIASAEAALERSPNNSEAHRVLGTVYSALVGQQLVRDTDVPAGQRQEYVRLAVEHLEKARLGQPFNAGLDFTLGRLYLQSGEYEAAETVLAGFIEEVPGSREGLLLLARARVGLGNTDGAVRMLEAALVRQPAFYRASLLLAELYERADRWDEAADVYARALEENPRRSELKRQRAMALLNAGEPGAARDLLREVVADDPDDANELFLLVQAELQARDYEGAEQAAHRLIEIEPADLRGPYALSLVFERRHEPRRVVETLVPALADRRGGQARSGLRPTLLAHLGFAYLTLADYPPAIEAFEQAGALEPSNPTYGLYEARAQLAAGNAETAATVAAATRRRHSEDIRLIRVEAEALHASGRTPAALALLRDTVDAQPDEPAAHVALAAFYRDASQADEAVRVLESAGERFPDDTSISFELGAVFERQKRYADAERQFRRVVRREPAHAAALNYLGYMLADRGERLEEAVRYIERALAVDPQNGAYADSLGWAYFKLNKLDLAEIHLRRAGAALARNSVVQDHLGDVMFSLGRYDEAVAAWQRSLQGDGEEIDPNQIEGKIDRATEAARRLR